jgi:hypothetical protein
MFAITPRIHMHISITHDVYIFELAGRYKKILIKYIILQGVWLFLLPCATKYGPT